MSELDHALKLSKIIELDFYFIKDKLNFIEKFEKIVLIKYLLGREGIPDMIYEIYPTINYFRVQNTKQIINYFCDFRILDVYIEDKNSILEIVNAINEFNDFNDRKWNNKVVIIC